ncbi:MAG: electron transfer flavoprotein subunit beta/FixA family protein [Dehalococcoidia bacterium]|nr:electron transfer flavoprotein subunit beta/FixA family protein [Dehalococcoidia bacterium]
MNIIVCVKQIQDPEIPPAKFKVDPATNRVVPPEGVPPVINPFDEQSIEAALRIKEKAGGKITALTVGKGSARDVLKHALAMGADEAFMLDDDAFDGSDSQSMALILSRAIQRIGPFDLVFCGRQAADWDEAQVGSALAEALGIPPITIARSAQVVDGKIRVERVQTDGYEVVEASLPALVTVSNEIGQPRLPTGFGIIQASRKKITQWKASDIGLSPAEVGPAAARTRLLKLFVPVRESKCEFVKGETVAEAAALLAVKLREAKIL